MERLRSRATIVSAVFALCFGLLWFSACGQGDLPADAPEIQNPTSDAGFVCDHPSPGCPCDAAGATASCGKVTTKIGTYVACSMGKTTCDGQKWGLCVGDTVVAQSFIGGGARIVQSLGVSMPSCTNPSTGVVNQCDPYCNQFTDTPSGVDAAGLTQDDANGGFYIPPNAGSGACTCNQPAAPSSLYSSVYATNKGNPSSCSGTTDAGAGTDNCNHDYQCVNGACRPYAVAGVNPACTAAPDYTLGLGCYDGSSWELQVCNRGYVPSPGVGHLMIAIGSGSPSSTVPSSCTTQTTGASWPTGPAISATAQNQGQCDIDLATNVIGAGQCINVSLASQCTRLDGTTPLTFGATDHLWAVVNPSASLLSGTSTTPECDTCNNYTAFEQSDLPPALSSAAQCLTTTCGTVCGGSSAAGIDGGSGCHTYVSGTMYDPGANIPLPGIAVYELKPTATLPTFSSSVSCDTCQSVLPPMSSMVGSTYSDIDGTFNLEVDSTTNIPVVFQTGRWRRKITIGVDTPALTACAVNNITVPADCTYPGTNCKTRLPQTHLEGDIPHIAFVTGRAEPFECSVAKFMGGSSEMSVPGGGTRLEMYKDTGVGGVPTGTRTGTTASIGTPPVHASGTEWILGSGGTISNLSNLTWSGTKQSVASGGTVTGLSNMSASYVGGNLTMWGGTKSGNNGTFPIASYVSSSSVTITDPSAASDGNNGRSSFGWAAAGPNGVLTSAFVGGTITLTGGANTANNGTFDITSVPSNSSVVVSGTSATSDTNSGRSASTWNAYGPGALQISGLSGILAADVGQILVLTGASSSGNNGSFAITSVLNSTTVTIQNPNAVANDSKNGQITWSISAGSYALPASTTLWPQIGNYDEVLLPCGTTNGNVANISSTDQASVYSWMESGGRMFLNHWSAFGLLVPSTSGGRAMSPWNATSTFQSTFQGAPSSIAMTGRVSPNATPSAPQTTFKNWLTQEGAYSGGGVSTPQPVSGEALVPSATNSFEWLRGSASSTGSGSATDNWTNVPGGNYSLIYSFDTNSSGIVPTLAADGGAGPGCGRTVVSDMHVDVSRATSTFTSGYFPNSCLLTASLSPNEQAFEYLMFMLSSCAIGGAPIINSAPPAPPAPAPLTAVTYTRDYHAVCPTMGTAPVWQLLQWQAEIPTGTSIAFAAQTAQDSGGSPGTYGASVPAGTATTTSTTTVTAGTTIDQDLRAASPAQISQAWLRLSITLKPTGTTSPILDSWNVTYDCKPSE